MDSRERTEGSYPELFPKDYPERLERLIELAGLTREEFAERHRPQSALPGAFGEAAACLPNGSGGLPQLDPYVRAFFVALYRPRPLTASANSLDRFLPSLVQTAPSASQSSLPATAPRGCRPGPNWRSRLSLRAR